MRDGGIRKMNRDMVVKQLIETQTPPAQVEAIARALVGRGDEDLRAILELARLQQSSERRYADAIDNWFKGCEDIATSIDGVLREAMGDVEEELLRELLG